MRSVVLIVALLLSTQAVAQSYPIKATSYCDQKHVPPAEFDFEPNVPYRVVPVPPYAVTGICNFGWTPVDVVGACVDDQRDANGIIIWVRNDLTPGERACVMRHERAHLNGWRHDYEIAKPYPQGRTGHLRKYVPVP